MDSLSRSPKNALIAALGLTALLEGGCVTPNLVRALADEVELETGGRQTCDTRDKTLVCEDIVSRTRCVVYSGEEYECETVFKNREAEQDMRDKLEAKGEQYQGNTVIIGNDEKGTVVISC